MKNKWLWGVFLVLTFVFFAGCTTTNTNRYSVSEKYWDKNIAPVFCNDERGKYVFCFNGNVYNSSVFVEKEGKEKRYFWAGYEEGYTGGDSSRFYFKITGEKHYISIDDILPKSEAEKIYNTVFFGFGGTTGSGNISSRAYKRQEELQLGQQIRSESLDYWKSKYPNIYKMFTQNLPYWEKYNDNIRVWLAKIVRFDSIGGYDALLTYVDNLKPNTRPPEPYRGENAVPHIASTAYNLFTAGKISSNGYRRILNYVQLNHGVQIFQFMVQRNMSAEEFCMGVDSGDIILTF